MAEGGIAIVLTAEGRRFLARQRGSQIGARANRPPVRRLA
jgi:hypothetical protein